MQKILKKIFISTLNVFFLGLGFAISDNIGTAIIVANITAVLALIAAYTGMLDNFHVFLSLGAVALISFIYAVFVPLFAKKIKFERPVFGAITFIAVTFTILTSAYLVRTRFYDTIKAAYEFADIIKKDDVIIMSRQPHDSSLIVLRNKTNGGLALQKKGYPVYDNYEIYGYPLYIIYSPDWERIGENLEK